MSFRYRTILSKRGHWDDKGMQRDSECFILNSVEISNDNKVI